MRQEAVKLLLSLIPEMYRDQFAPLLTIGMAQMNDDAVKAFLLDVTPAVDAAKQGDASELLAIGERYGITPDMFVGLEAMYGRGAA